MTGFEIAAFIGSNRSRSAVIPTKVGIQFFEFQSFPINCLSIECLDSRLRGNDGIWDYSVSRKMGNGGNCVKNAVWSLSDGICGIRTFKNPIIPAQEGIRIHPHRNLHPVIPAQAGIQCVEFQLFRINFETLIASFPRKWESRNLMLRH